MAKKTNTAGFPLRRSISLLLAICTLLLMVPGAFAASAGTSPSAVTDSATKVYVKLSKAVSIFTTDTTPSTGAVTAASGSVLQLVSDSTYTVNSTQYGCLYYDNTRYNVLWSDVSGDVLTAAQLETYVTGTLWTTTEYTSLKQELGLVGDVRVYGLQLALRTLGYYTLSLDGKYGSGTASAVKSFQRNYKLDVDGYAGPYTQKVLYPLAIASFGSSGTTTGTLAGTLVTTASINLRKSYSTKTARLAVVPKNTTLSYTKTITSSGVIWYYVTYGTYSGWLMGTYVSANGSSSSTTTPTANLGTVTANTNTVVRKTANGTRTGYLLSKKSTATLLAAPTTVGEYTWYYVQIANGVKGYVRGDCVDVTYDAGGGLTPSSSKTYIKVTASGGLALFTSEEQSSTGATTAPKGSVLQLVSTDTYTKNSVVYCGLYYDNTRYNCVYSNISSMIMSAAEVSTYITGTIWPAGYSMAGTLKDELDLQGNIYVHSAQYALTLLGYYTGALDGNFGSGTIAAIRNFQKAVKVTVDGSIGPETSDILYPKAIAALTGGTSTTSDFGTVTKVVKATWDTVDGGSVSLFGKNSVAKVMDMKTQLVFNVRRWAGAYHADCVPLTAADTKIMCDIVGFTYNSNHPTSAQLQKIISDSDSSDYIWPDFKGAFTGVSSIGSAWDRRPAYLNVNGTVYCVSIYGWPHGYSDVKTYAADNNYYGMMCVHFLGSKTHTGNQVDTLHQANINTAYANASSLWPGKVK